MCLFTLSVCALCVLASFCVFVRLSVCLCARARASALSITGSNDRLSSCALVHAAPWRCLLLPPSVGLLTTAFPSCFNTQALALLGTH